MKRLRPVSCVPAPAQNGSGDKYPFAEDLLGILIPLFVNKHPQNPVGGGGNTPDTPQE